MAYQHTFGQAVGRSADARGESHTGREREGGRWIQRVLFATGASLFVVSLAIVTGAGPLSPLGPIAGEQDGPDESTPRPAGTAEPTPTPTGAPTPTKAAPQTTDRPTTDGATSSPTNSTDDPFGGVGESPTPTTAGGNRTDGNQTATPGGNETTSGTTTTSDDGGIFG